jgi:CO/xanthine dehydrogenase Mo-binding subunit/aerobic-type carbon monoxide dehydrogenase small subunit (CoxS/CutS family)
MIHVRLTVNGALHDVDASPERPLLNFLREELGLTAAKYGCGEGVCGACTVVVDGEVRTSCNVPVASFDGGEIATLEGLAEDPVQRALAGAFLAGVAYQCGYCTPGMIVAATGLLRDHPDAGDDEIVAAMDRNICRCGAYRRIARAIGRARDTLRMPGSAPGPTKALDSQAPLPTASAPAFARPARPWDQVEPHARDYFDRLGNGIVTVLPPDEVERLAESRGVWSTDGGAWIHLGADGRATAFSGKVDVGQDNRTALTALVAEELGIGLEAIELVMGDTDLCPFDIGTFGSRSMADAGTVLRIVAAGLRRRLTNDAAARWEIDADDLDVADGSVRTRDGSRDIPFGDLVRGRRDIDLATADEQLRPTSEWSAAGRAQRRRDGPEIVAGRRRYTTDIALPGMFHGRVGHPPAIGAELVAVDSAGIGGRSVVLVRNAEFVGIAAPDPTQAEGALEALAISWSDGDATPSESDLDAFLRDHPVEAGGWEGHVEHVEGDVDAARTTASTELEATYTTAYVAHVPLETRAAVAEWDRGGSGRLTIWTGTQRPFGVREAVADALGLVQADVRVIVPATGSAFGGKHHVEVAIEAARLARAAGRPVKVRWSRAEEFQHAYVRPAAVIDVRASVRPDGRLLSWEFANVNSGGNAIETPYEVPNQRIRYQPAASPLPQGSYRGLAATANTFARESAMDELSGRLGLDPLRFRLLNLADDRLAAVVTAAAGRFGWTVDGGRPRIGPDVGLGIGLGFEKGGRVATCAAVRLGGGRLRVERIVTAYDCGAIVDPDNLVNQIEGATVMGLGGALFEAVHFDGGRITNGSLSAYRVPRFSDVPEIEAITIDRPDQPSAGAGETPLIAVAPAIANAIEAGGGRRIRSLPLNS